MSTLKARNSTFAACPPLNGGITETCKKDLDETGLFGGMVGHVGDGNFHETILYDGEDEKAKVEKCVHDMVDNAISMDGTCTVGLNSFFHRMALILIQSDFSRENMELAWGKRRSFRPS